MIGLIIYLAFIIYGVGLFLSGFILVNWLEEASPRAVTIWAMLSAFALILWPVWIVPWLARRGWKHASARRLVRI